MEIMRSSSNGLVNETNYSIQQESSQGTKDFYVYTYQPCHRIRHVKVRPHYFLSVLDMIYPKDSILIYKGQILDRQYSFDFYKMLNDDKIIVLPFHLKKSSPELIDKWRKETLDTENFEEKIKLQIDSDCRKELSRIKDLKLFKSELKRRKNESSRNMLNSLYEDKKKYDIQLNIQYPQNDSPSCDPLPTFWK